MEEKPSVRVLANCQKRAGMLREPQHERKIITGINSPPFVPSVVEGLRGSFSAICCVGLHKSLDFDLSFLALRQAQDKLGEGSRRFKSMRPYTSFFGVTCKKLLQHLAYVKKRWT
jgi:hypothetical protein